MSNSYAEKPYDIQNIEKVSKKIQSNYKSKVSRNTTAVSRSFVSMVHKNCGRLISRHSIEKLIDKKSPQFTKHVMDVVTPQVEQKMRLSSSAERLKGLRELLRQLSTENAAYAIINSYLDVPQNDTLVPKYAPKRTPFLLDQVSISSNDSRFDLSIDPKSVVVDFGGSGTGNGIIDQGEWIQYSIEAMNTSDRPFFSSSLYLRSSGICSWAFPQSELELPELAPSAKKAFPIWVYVSTQCSN
jgi:hypothetical protein